MTAELAGGAPADEAVETARLTLRRHGPGDAVAFARLLDNWNVVRWLAAVPFPYRLGDAADWIARCEATWTEGSERQFTVARLPDDRVVGHIGLRLGEDGRAGELGYWIGQAYWGRGYAGEAVGAAVAYAFDALDVVTLWALCRPDNRTSLALLGRLGFREAEGRRGRCDASALVLRLDR